jgi:two-component system cell cycle response regulator
LASRRARKENRSVGAGDERGAAASAPGADCAFTGEVTEDRVARKSAAGPRLARDFRSDTLGVVPLNEDMSQGGDARSRSGVPNDSLRTLKLDEGASVRDELYRSIRDDRKPVLVVMSGNEIGARRKLSDNIVAGRAPDAGLHLSDAGVSWHHARFEDRGGDWAVVDLGSTNGVTVNGKKCAEAILAANDRIALGRTVLRFEEQDAIAAAYDEQMERMVSIDDLSGLLLRRRFDRETALLLDAARQKGGALGLIVMDLDGVKKINDTHGHVYGAHVIGGAGHRIGDVLRGRAIASRFGGDEFCAAVADADADKCVAIAHEILHAIGDKPFEKDGLVLRVGVSIGVASFPVDATDAATLFRLADEAMYRAKQAGKHRVSR